MQLDQAFDALLPKLPSLLQTLVDFRTINPPGNQYDEITLHLVKALQDSGLKARRLTPAAALQRKVLPPSDRHLLRHNVLGEWKVPGAKRTLHFNAHYDVVPVGGTWTHGDPFSGKVEKGWIYGRGTADMKGSIASLLTALRALQLAGLKPSVNVEVSFTADEETDSLLGSGWMVEHAPLKADAVVVMEGAEHDQICCGHNGVVWLEVDVLGKAAHGSRPDMGINAFEKMSALILALEDYKRKLASRPYTAPDGTIMRPTVNLGGVFTQGPGGKINTVPDKATFSIDRRVLPRESVKKAEAELVAALKAAAKAIPQCRIEIRKVSENFPCFSEPEAKVFQSLARSIQSVRGNPVSFGVSTGFTDMQFYAQYLKVPTLGYGPGGEREHAIDERARLQDLADCARTYAHLLLTPASELF